MRGEGADRVPKAGARIRLAVFAAAALVFLYLVQGVLPPFLFAGVLAYVTIPAIEWLTTRTRLPRALFAGATLALFLGLVAMVLGFGIPALAAQLKPAAADLQGSLNALFERIFGARTIVILGQPIGADTMVQAIKSWLDQPGHAGALARWSGAVLFEFVLGWVLLAYFLFDTHRISRGLWWLVPPVRRTSVRHFWKAIDPALRRYVLGVAIVVSYTSAAAYVGLGVFLGLSDAVALALLTGVLEVVPVIGPATAAVIAGLIAVAEAKSAGSIVAYAIYAVALRISVDQLIGPLVLGRSASLPPALVIFCFLTGGALFGITGVVLGVPVALAIKAALTIAYREQSDSTLGEHAD